MNLPVQLFEGYRDLEVVSQHVEGREDVSPLHHLPQWAPLQHLGTEDVPRLLRQKANVDEDLDIERKQVFFCFFFPCRRGKSSSSISNSLQVRP